MIGEIVIGDGRAEQFTIQHHWKVNVHEHVVVQCQCVQHANQSELVRTLRARRIQPIQTGRIVELEHACTQTRVKFGEPFELP